MAHTIPNKADSNTRALMLFLTLQSHAILYTPLSHRGQRAARILPRLEERLAEARLEAWLDEANDRTFGDES